MDQDVFLDSFAPSAMHPLFLVVAATLSWSPNGRELASYTCPAAYGSGVPSHELLGAFLGAVAMNGNDVSPCCDACDNNPVSYPNCGGFVTLGSTCYLKAPPGLAIELSSNTALMAYMKAVPPSAPPPPSACIGSFHLPAVPDTELDGGTDVMSYDPPDSDCCAQCLSMGTDCTGFVLYANKCWIKKGVLNYRSEPTRPGVTRT